MYETRGEFFKINCKDGYMLPNGKAWERIFCTREGHLAKNTFDCIPKKGDIISKVGSTFFKCKLDVGIAEAPAVYVSDHVRWSQTCYDECVHDSNCR